MSKIKICGLSRKEDIEAVNEALPDYIGFVFASSPRQVSASQAGVLKQTLDSRIKAVGVFVDADIETVAALCRDGVIDMMQLHGIEDAIYIRKLKEALSVPVIKAVRVQNAEQIIDAQSLDCDYLLLDTWQKGIQGGSGVAFDWSLIPQLKKPYFLAGGLNAENILEAARHQPYCLDVSSGAETEGKKDRRKIIELVRLIRRQDK
jgi:phosphoribosylanthranilate isomerase